MKRALAYALVAFSGCAVAFAQQDAGRGTAEGTIKGKKVTFDYGRPPLKGRTLDSLIAQLPPDRVWRAGTNEVTTLTTEAALTVGGKRVPAGKYSVYLHCPEQGDWSLILNSDQGIELAALGKILGFTVPDSAAKKPWPHLEGYKADAAKKTTGIADKEVARQTMKSGTSSTPVDPFSIAVKPSAAGGLTVTFAWADKTWSTDLNAAS